MRTETDKTNKKLTRAQIEVLTYARTVHLEPDNGRVTCGYYCPCGERGFAATARALERRGLVVVMESGRYYSVRGVCITKEGLEALESVEKGRVDNGSRICDCDCEDET